MGKTFVNWLFGSEITIKTFADKIGHLFNNTLFNVSTSGVGVGLTGQSCVVALGKAAASPLPWCKCLYITSAALNGVSCTANSLCLLSTYSSIAPIPVFTGMIARITSVGAETCTAVADCTDPALGLTATGINTCINLALKQCGKKC